MKKVIFVLLLSLLFSLCACQAANENMQPATTSLQASMPTPTNEPTGEPTAEPTVPPTAATEPTFPPVTPETLIHVDVLSNKDNWFSRRGLEVPEGIYLVYYLGPYTGRYKQILDFPVHQAYKASTCIYYTTEENATQLMRCDYEDKHQEVAYTATVGPITDVSSCDVETYQHLYVLENDTHVFKVDLNTGEKTLFFTADKIYYVSVDTYSSIPENWDVQIGLKDHIAFFDLRTGEFERYYHDCSD